MLSIGDSKVSKLFLGDTECKKAYLGNMLVFGDSIPKMEWIKTALPFSLTWRNLCFTGDRFVCVPASDRTVIYSYDGVDWETYPNKMITSGLVWSSLAFDGNKTLVAFSSSGSNGSTVVNYSLDKGNSWESATLPTAANIDASAYGNGRFIALANNVNKYFYSTNGGTTWAASTMAKQAWSGLVYGNNKFVAVSSGSNRSLYSEDGTKWSFSSMPATLNWIDVTYGNGKFVAIAQQSKIGAYSFDGKTWIEMSLPSSRYWVKLTYGNGKFLAISGGQYGSETSAYSEDGINWVELKLPEVKGWSDISYGFEKFVVVSGYSATSTIGAYLIP